MTTQETAEPELEAEAPGLSLLLCQGSPSLCPGFRINEQVEAQSWVLILKGTVPKPPCLKENLEIRIR